MGHRVVLSNTTVLFLLSFAYDVHNTQVVDRPHWIASEKFDFNAVSDTPDTPNLPQVKIMIQKMLANRFELKFHRENRELSAYLLTVAKNGPKLNKSVDAPNAMPSLLLQPGSHGMGAMRARNVTMADFANLLQSGILDRPVVDQTSLKGRYDFLLNWTPDESQFTQAGIRIRSPSGTEDALSLFTAIQEQLGLKLAADRKTPVEVHVIDHIEQPSQN